MHTLKDQIETPALLIDLDLLEENIETMARYMRDKRAKLRPHFKTHKCLAIAHKQIAAGAKGITCAKLGEAEVLASAGIRDILIANQVVEPSKIARLAGLAHSDTKFGVAVDTLENIEDLSQAASRVGSTLNVLVEVDVGMGRCGVQSADEVLVLVRGIEKAKGLSFEGIQAYEGHLQNVQDPDKRKSSVAKMVDLIAGIKAQLQTHGVAVREISGGGTGTYDMTGDNTPWTEIQAGSYVFMDTLYNKLGHPFRNSLSILTTVIHKRHGFAVTDAGLKVCTVEHGLPEIKDMPGLIFQKGLSEEHGTIVDERDELGYLQKIEYIPSHCCTTANLHNQYYCVRKGVLESVWPVDGRGKSK
jgi:D-serine deaminase-like pyridoxal phosphate-dependent protein